MNFPLFPVVHRFIVEFDNVTDAGVKDGEVIVGPYHMVGGAGVDGPP
jgi:hypothetical protein